MILVDSNVLIDVIERDPLWRDWSSAKLQEAANDGRLVINHIVLAETAPRVGPLDRFLDLLQAMAVEIEQLSDQAAYLAGHAYQKYRRNRKPTTEVSILADFFIGGHAESLNVSLLTRDPRFYRTYFPAVPLITPETTKP